MDQDHRLEVSMELDGSGGQHISGRLELDGDVREFSGWLSLLALLEGLRADGGSSRAPPGGSVGQLEAAEPAGAVSRPAPPYDP